MESLQHEGILERVKQAREAGCGEFELFGVYLDSMSSAISNLQSEVRELKGQLRELSRDVEEKA